MRRLDAKTLFPIVASSLFALGVAACSLAIGPSRIVLAPWDVFINLDEAGRLLAGQVPGVDFHNPAGPFTFWLTALGMRVVGTRLQALVVGNVVFLLIAAVSAIIVGHRRLPHLRAFLFVAFVVVLVAAPRQIGRGADIPSYSEIYNRYGWTLISIFFLQLFLPLRAAARSQPACEGLVAGFLVGLSLYVKVTYFIVACAGLAYASLTNPRWRRLPLLLALLAGLLLTVLGSRLFTGMSLGAYLRDIGEASHAQTVARRMTLVKMTVKHAALGVSFLGVVWSLLVAVPTARRRMPLRGALLTTATTGFSGLCGLLIAFGNSGEQGEIPLFAIVGLFLLSEGAENDSGIPATPPRWAWSTSAVVVAGGLAGPTFAQDVAALGSSAAWRLRGLSMPESQRFDSEGLRDFVIPADVGWTTEFWKSAQLPARLNDGFALARRFVSSGQSILTLAFSNPFPYALGCRSPRGTPVFFDLDNNFNSRHHRAAEQLFDDVDFVISPIIRDNDSYRGGRSTVDALHKIYALYLDQNYMEVGRSRYWVLLGRQPGTVH